MEFSKQCAAVKLSFSIVFRPRSTFFSVSRNHKNAPIREQGTGNEFVRTRVPHETPSQSSLATTRGGADYVFLERRTALGMLRTRARGDPVRDVRRGLLTGPPGRRTSRTRRRAERLDTTKTQTPGVFLPGRPRTINVITKIVPPPRVATYGASSSPQAAPWTFANGFVGAKTEDTLTHGVQYKPAKTSRGTSDFYAFPFCADPIIIVHIHGRARAVPARFTMCTTLFVGELDPPRRRDVAGRRRHQRIY